MDPEGMMVFGPLGKRCRRASWHPVGLQPHNQSFIATEGPPLGKTLPGEVGQCPTGGDNL